MCRQIRFNQFRRSPFRIESTVERIKIVRMNCCCWHNWQVPLARYGTRALCLITTTTLVLPLVSCSSIERVGRESKRSPTAISSPVPFREYDRNVVTKIQERWYALIRKFSLYQQSGTVEVTFDLRPDGRIENLKITKSSVGQSLGRYCLQAVEDSAPFDPLPSELHHGTGDEPRAVTFTFRY